MAIAATIVSAAVGAASTIAAATGTGFFAAFAAAGFLKTFLVNAAVGLALFALSPKPKSIGSQRGYPVTTKVSAGPHQIIYGETKVGGVIVYETAGEASSGDERNEWLSRVIAWAGHEVSWIRQYYLDEEPVTLFTDSDGNQRVSEGRWRAGSRSRVYLSDRNGNPNQGAITQIVSLVSNGQWSSSHRLRGVAHSVASFKFHEDVFPNGPPDVTALIRGKRVYDPRSGATAWSDNPALCLRDYLTNNEYGLGEGPTNIDDAFFIEAANACDTFVGGAKRFTCNGAFTTDQTPADIIDGIASSMGGIVWYSQGKWRCRAAVYKAPTVSLDENDLRSPINLSTRQSRRDNFNTVNGTFKGPETNWKVADYPPVTNPQFVAADGGLEQSLDLDLPFTDNSVEARRIARIALERNRQQISFEAAFGLEAFKLQVGDIVRITNERFGWTNKEFEVVQWSFGLTDDNDLQVPMTLREISAAVFNEFNDGIALETDNTELRPANYVPRVGLSLTTELRIINQEVFGIINAEVESDNEFIYQYEVQYKKSSNSTYKTLGVSGSKSFELLLPEDDTYDVRARGISPFGVRGAWTTFTNFTAKPFASPPEDVTGFSASVAGGTAQLYWDAVSDLDLSHYEIRYSSATSGASWPESVVLIPKVARPGTNASAPARQGSYLIKAVDKLGNKSVNATATIVLTNLTDTLGLNVVQTYQEDPDFNGNKTNVVKQVDDIGDSYLILDTSINFDDAAGDFDDQKGLFDGGGGFVTESGIYEFENALDLGAKYSVYLSGSISFRHLNYIDTFDSVEGLFEDRSGLFDGDPSSLDSASAKVQFAYTDDDPDVSPTYSEWQDLFAAEISARAIKFRCILVSTDGQVAPRVDTLSATTDMPDRTTSENNIDFTGTTDVTFPSAFYTTSTPAIGLALTGLSSGDYYEITSKDNEGFTITVYDNTDTQLTAPTQLDYVAKGFGKEITV